MPQNSNFWLLRGHRFFPKNGSYGYGAKSRWGPPRVHLGANGVPLVKKMGQNRKKLPCPKILIFEDPAVIDFSQKIEVTAMASNHGGDPLGSILGPMGSNWVKKMGQTVKNYHAPKFEFSTTPRSSIFPKKMEVSVIAPNHSGDPLGSILGPMGSHWVKKMGQNRKKLPCPKIRIFDYRAVIDFSEKMEVTVMAPNHGGDPLKSVLGPMGSHWVKKMGQNRKKLPCPKIRIFDYSLIFLKKWKLRFWRQVTVRTP